MVFDIKITGLDKVTKTLDGMVKDVEPERFAEWADKIEKAAKVMCNDPDCKRITFKVKKGTTKISISVKDKEALECVRKSIKKHLSSMSLGIKTIYSKIVLKKLKDMEKQLDDEV